MPSKDTKEKTKSVVWSSGRGGAGNISKSKDTKKRVPIDPDVRPQAKLLEIETARNRSTASGRGGSGNKYDHVLEPGLFRRVMEYESARIVAVKAEHTANKAWRTQEARPNGIESASSFSSSGSSSSNSSRPGTRLRSASTSTFATSTSGSSASPSNHGSNSSTMSIASRFLFSPLKRRGFSTGTQNTTATTTTTTVGASTNSVYSDTTFNIDGANLRQSDDQDRGLCGANVGAPPMIIPERSSSLQALATDSPSPIVTTSSPSSNLGPRPIGPVGEAVAASTSDENATSTSSSALSSSPSSSSSSSSTSTSSSSSEYTPPTPTVSTSMSPSWSPPRQARLQGGPGTRPIRPQGARMPYTQPRAVPLPTTTTTTEGSSGYGGYGHGHGYTPYHHHHHPRHHPHPFTQSDIDVSVVGPRQATYACSNSNWSNLCLVETRPGEEKRKEDKELLLLDTSQDQSQTQARAQNATSVSEDRGHSRGESPAPFMAYHLPLRPNIVVRHNRVHGCDGIPF